MYHNRGYHSGRDSYDSHTYQPTYTYQSTYIHIPVYIHTHTSLHTYTYQPTYIHIPAYIHTHTGLHTYTYQRLQYIVEAIWKGLNEVGVPHDNKIRYQPAFHTGEALLNGGAANTSLQQVHVHTAMVSWSERPAHTLELLYT